MEFLPTTSRSDVNLHLDEGQGFAHIQVRH